MLENAEQRHKTNALIVLNLNFRKDFQSFEFKSGFTSSYKFAANFAVKLNERKIQTILIAFCIESRELVFYFCWF